jgi:hypothetical protein
LAKVWILGNVAYLEMNEVYGLLSHFSDAALFVNGPLRAVPRIPRVLGLAIAYVITIKGDKPVCVA